MKKSILSFAAVALLLSGCASSARMMRMSGGVMDSYAPPESHRIRSEKYRQSVANFRPGDEHAAILDTKASLVNLWPFFFRSNQYFSILWPLADWDPYGVAIRPFYNHEGDDYSILFPWCAWNATDHSGWCVPFIWNQRHIAALPLFWYTWGKHGSGTHYISPLYIHTWNNKSKPDWNRPKVSENFTTFCLAYWSRNFRYDTMREPLVREYRINHKSDARLRSELLCRSVKIDKGTEAAARYADEAWKRLPVVESGDYGFFPLFHRHWSQEETSLRLLLFAYGEKRADHREYSFLGPWLGRYSETACSWENRYGNTGWTYDAWFLLSRFVRRDHFTGEKYRQTTELCAMAYNNDSAYDSKLMKEKLKALGLTIPPNVTDKWSFRLWIKDWCKAQKFPVETSYYGGFLPLFNYSYTSDSAKWFAPALLTYYNGKKDTTFWWSLPLLSVSSKEPEEELFMTAGPLLYFSKSIRVPQVKSGNCRIHNRETLWASECDQIEYTHRYALCGLFYRGNDSFFVEKAGLPAGVAEEVRKKIASLYQESKQLKQQEKTLLRRTANNDARKIENKVDYYEQLAERERIKLEQKKLDGKKRKAEEQKKALTAKAKSIGFTVPVDFQKDEAHFRAAQQALIAQCAEPRKHSDIGGGIVYHKELFYNGDSRWNFCWVLAGGEKRGDYEKTQILQLLYRCIRQGSKSETLCFPFIAVRRDGDDSQCSFMWRVFNLERKNGKWGGHILFIPLP